MSFAIVKPALDVGIQLACAADGLPAMLDFWQQQVGAAFDHTLPLGGGRRQHRHRWGDSVLKLNHSRDGLAPAQPAGWRRLLLASDKIDDPRTLEDPEGNAVVVLPPGTDGVEQLTLELAVPDAVAALAFYRDALGLPQADADELAVGASRLRLRGDPDAPTDPPLATPGYAYITLQVDAVDAAYAAAIDAGGREGSPPQTLGDVARIAFVRDPAGNWIELSQRRSIVGHLDTPDAAADAAEAKG